MGNVGKPKGCQSSIVHLVSNVESAIGVASAWAISDGNAGAGYTRFNNEIVALDELDWEIIASDSWGGELRRNKKSAEFLVADFFPWQAIDTVVCHNSQIAICVSELLAKQVNAPNVVVQPNWYY